MKANYDENLSLSASLSDNLNILHQLFSNCSDIIYREFFISNIHRSAALIFINGLIDNKLINVTILPSLMNIEEVPSSTLTSSYISEISKSDFLKISEVKEASTICEIVNALLDGKSAFLLDGETTSIIMKTQGWKDRSVSEATNEKVTRGPKESFNENIITNTALLRRRIKSHKLKVEEHIVGKLTQTKINICYIHGIAKESIVNEVKKRIEKIDIDSVLESGYIEEFIEDTKFTLFPQIQHTERPDKAAGNLLEGRIIILVDGTPFVLITPATLIEFFQSCDDYYERYPVALFVRMIRFVFAGIALLMPGCYIAIVSFHKEMIPTPLYISIILAAHGVPFPIFIEALIMEIVFEALREAGLRLPSPANQTVGIVGVLVIGDASVKAGIVSPIMVVIIAITAIASFSIPSYDMGYSFRILRFLMLFLGAFFGLYGVMLGLLALLIHLASLKSFSVNYLSPLAPLKLKDLKDVIVRFPWWSMKKRPSFASNNNEYREDSSFISPTSKDNKDKKG